MYGLYLTIISKKRKTYLSIFEAAKLIHEALKETPNNGYSNWQKL